MVNIYILACQDNKYYVGKTTQPVIRINEHFQGFGAQWTKLYPPISIEKFIANCDNFDEDKWTLKYMAKKGINNVRGGSFCQFNLSPENKHTISQMIAGSMDRCFICGGEDHFANNCRLDEEDVKGFLQLKDICERCHRLGHQTSQCYATTYLNGGYIKDQSSGNNQRKNKFIRRKKQPEIVCWSCGRGGHLARQCYAVRDINGHSLDKDQKILNHNMEKTESKWCLVM